MVPPRAAVRIFVPRACVVDPGGEPHRGTLDFSLRIAARRCTSLRFEALAGSCSGPPDNSVACVRLGGGGTTEGWS